jgi:hypothetical protein
MSPPGRMLDHGARLAGTGFDFGSGTELRGFRLAVVWTAGLAATSITGFGGLARGRGIVAATRAGSSSRGNSIAKRPGCRKRPATSSAFGPPPK